MKYRLRHAAHASKKSATSTASVLSRPLEHESGVIKALRIRRHLDLSDSITSLSNDGRDERTTKRPQTVFSSTSILWPTMAPYLRDYSRLLPSRAISPRSLLPHLFWPTRAPLSFLGTGLSNQSSSTLQHTNKIPPSAYSLYSSGSWPV